MQVLFSPFLISTCMAAHGVIDGEGLREIVEEVKDKGEEGRLWSQELLYL